MPFLSSKTSETSASTAAPTVPANQWIKGIVYISLFGALFIAASFIKIQLGFTPIPITLQTFAIMLAGGLLGAVYGFWSIFIVVALTAFGLPLMGGVGGLAKIFGATGGFIWMFPIAAFLIGWVSDRLFAQHKKLNILQQVSLLLAVFTFGSLLLYVTGIPWLAHFSPTLDLAGALKGGMYPFLPGDIVKAIAATFVISTLRPMLPAVRPRKR